MTKGRRDPVEPGAVPYLLFRRAAGPAIVAAAGCVVIAAIWTGLDGAFGALLGAAVVLVFYGSDLVILRVAERKEPASLMPLMMTEYLIKVVLLAFFFVLIWNTTAFSVRAMAATVAVSTVVWVTALAIFAVRVATFSVDVSADLPTREK